ARGHALAHRDVQELVRAVGVGVRAEHAGDHELRTRELLAKHAHERDRAAFTHVHRRSEEHTSELQSRENLVCRLLLAKKKKDSSLPCLEKRQFVQDSNQTRMNHDLRSYI